MKSRILIAFLVSWLAFPSGLLASPRLLIPPMGSVANERARISLAEAFERSGRVKVVPLKRIDEYLLRSGSPEGAEEVRNQAIRDFEEGKKAFRELDLERAEEFWRKSKSAWEKVAISSKDFVNFRRAKFSLALALFGQEESVAVQKELKELLVMDPFRAKEGRTPQAKNVPPAFIEEFENTRKEVLQLPTGKLTIDSDPRGALVVVNGKSEGMTTEAEIFDLPIGKHYIVLKREGYKTLTKPVLINAGENRILERLEKDQGSLAGRPFYPLPKGEDLSPHEIARLDEISRELKGDLLLLLQPQEGRVAAQFFDFRTTELSGVEIGKSPDETVEKLLLYLDDAGYVDPDLVKKREVAKRQMREKAIEEKTQIQSLKDSMNRTPPDRKLAKGSPWYENHWVWVGIGAALAAGGVGVWMLTRSSSDNSTLTVTFP